MKKIAFFINSLEGGGAERILSTIINELYTSFHITLILMEDKIDYEIPKDIDIMYLGNKNINKSNFSKLFNIFFLSYEYARLCKNLNIDYSFSLTLRPNLINSLSRFFYDKSKTILYEVATPSLQYQNKSLSSWIIKILIKKIYPLAKILISNSYGVANDLKKNFNIKNSIKVIYSPIDIGFIRNISNQKCDIFENDKRIKFITVGRLDAGKNHQMMIKSFSKLSDINTVLYILGDGILKQELEELVYKLNLKNRVIFLGFDNNPYKYLSKADIFLFSSNFEGFPTVLIEALACSLPIVSTDCLNGPREILDKNINNCLYHTKEELNLVEYGILTPVQNELVFHDAMNLIINNTKLKLKYKQNSYDRSIYFSKEKSINSIKKIFNNNLEILCVE